MAVVRTTGDAIKLGEPVFRPLYGAVPTLSIDVEKRGVGVWERGTVARILHAGPYAEEATIARTFLSPSRVTGSPSRMRKSAVHRPAAHAGCRAARPLSPAAS